MSARSDAGVGILPILNALEAEPEVPVVLLPTPDPGIAEYGKPEFPEAFGGGAELADAREAA